MFCKGSIFHSWEQWEDDLASVKAVKDSVVLDPAGKPGNITSLVHLYKRKCLLCGLVQRRSQFTSLLEK